MHYLRVLLSIPLYSFLMLMISTESIRYSEPGAFVMAHANPAGPTFLHTEFDSVKTNLHDYIWPTDAGTKITSSFAEYRSTHFHGGIDISTNGQKGYKVFAVRDGYVYRIRITPNGYGKMLYVKHSDGYYSTYAHLLTFNESINALTHAEQLKHGTYAVDLYPDSSNAVVKKGQVIAYTGESGFGPPHLHFELRDENLNPINPRLFANYSVRDDIPPSIRRLLIAPLSFKSTIENAPKAKILSRFPGRKHQYRIPQTLRMHGLIGFGVEAADRLDGAYTKEGIHSMELYLDDSLTFAMQLDRVPAEETKQIDLHYDFPTILHGWGKFQKLYIDSGNTLPFYARKPVGTGIINTDKLSEGEHEYRIVCKDISGNSTELTGKLLANHTPMLQIEHVDDDGITLTGTNITSIEKCYVYGKNNSATEWMPYTFTRKQFEQDGTGIELPALKKHFDVVKVIVESPWGSRSAPMFYFNTKPQGSAREIHLTTEIKSDYVEFTVSTTGVFTSPPVLTVQDGNRNRAVALEAIELYKYTGVFRPADPFIGKRSVHVTADINSKPSSADDTFDLAPIFASTSNKASFFNNNLTLSFDSGAVYKTLLLETTADAIRNVPVYVLGPDDALLNKGVRVTVASPTANPSLGLYFRSNGGWIFQTSTPDKGNMSYSTTLTRTLGELALFKDSEPPAIGRLRVAPRQGKLFASFRYHDNLSGVDTDEIKMYIDDTLVIPEIDGEHNNVWYQAPESVGRGKHSLRITIKDRMKNESEVKRTFSVK